MAKVDDTKLADLSMDDLLSKLEVETARYNQLKFNHTVTPIENPAVLKQMRRDVARMKTELRVRELNNNAE